MTQRPGGWEPSAADDGMMHAMIERKHRLPSPTPGTTRELVSLHFGPADGGRKAVLQASLHADEVPGLLVAHHLRRRLGELEARGALQGEVVLVPFANPIGLSQWVLQSHEGRFDLGSGENFHRNYPDLASRAAEILEPRVRSGARVTVAEARAALRQSCSGTFCIGVSVWPAEMVFTRMPLRP